MTAETKPHFRSEYHYRQQYYASFLHGPIDPHAAEVMKMMGNKAYKAIVVFPEAVPWEPLQRPQQLLKEFARRGYLCFFCDPTGEPFQLREAEPNLFVVSGEAYLLPALRSQSVIVLCTWLMQMAWADLLPHKVLWYDVLDCLEFFSLYDENMLEKHRQTTVQADIVTYSAKSLQRYVTERPDAYYLPNAARIEDFEMPLGFIPGDMAPFVAADSPVIGYFGAVEEWFDDELVLELARRKPEWQFIIIGKTGIPKDKLDAPNVRLLGMKPYHQLVHYGKWFHAAIIPFRVNETTNGVSPVKFFEYAALGLPVVSTPLLELTAYRTDILRLAEGADEFEAALESVLAPEFAAVAAQEGGRFAAGHQWSERTDQAERLLEERLGAWKAYANYDPAGKAAVMTVTFLDYEGEKFYNGGAERYLTDLHRLMEQQGIPLTIYQYGHDAWLRRVRGIDVVSLSRGGQHAKQYTIPTVKTYSRLFQEQTVERSGLTVYSAFFNAWPYETSGSGIGIIHGVSWDNPDCGYTDGTVFWETNRRFIEGARLCGTLVSVDTNSANWLQTVDYALGHAIKVIPNYVDTDEFTPRADYDKPGGRIVILYPRRLYHARGLYLVLEVIDQILLKYPNVDFHFVGQGLDDDLRQVDFKIKRWPGRIKRYSLKLDDMPQAYRQVDISLIPTLYSEGTSLSCLEAMASGNAVIATRIGGLTDLVVDGYNGLLIEPNAHALRQAIGSLLDDPAKLVSFKQKATEVAEVFTKKRWNRQWTDIIASHWRSRADLSASPGRSRLIEIWLTKFPAERSAGQVIVSYLAGGDLVYVRVKDGKAYRSYSFGRLQWLDWEDPQHDEPDELIVERGIDLEFGRPVRTLAIEQGEWSMEAGS
ncbi:glycosyltransferase [Paenibacillus tyrfis]|uniref:glycosyltransferase n=1 Tax=Paenibacillus tyrfis TaxID=1501230 RepID=UPI000B59748A|nr:glycosyltransferase [Paenibacillus tyrfis]